MNNNTLTTLALTVTTGILAYIAGRNHDEKKKDILQGDIKNLKSQKDKARKELEEIRSEVSTFTDIRDANKAKEDYLLRKAKAQDEYNQLNAQVSALKNSLTSELKRMDPNYEYHLLNEINALKTENNSLRRSYNANIDEINALKTKNDRLRRSHNANLQNGSFTIQLL